MKSAALCLCTASLFLALPARAYVLEDSNWDPASLPVSYRLNESSIPPELGVATGRAAVDNGFASWAAAECTTFTSHNAGTTSLALADASDGENSIMWLNDSWPAELGDVDSVIGVTTPLWGRRGFFLDADIQFNNVGFTWSTTGARNTVDAQSIATHEEGHFLGLDHSASGSAIMFASYAGGLKRNLTSDDTAGVCAIYPRSGITPPPATADDPCAEASSSCGACTPNDGCGWCGATNSCASGTSTGPEAGSCASDWVWLPRDCASTGPGTAGGIDFGGACSAPGDCSTGGVCVGVSATSAFCSRSCDDDCGCPDGYSCLATRGGGRVCGPGTNACESPPVETPPVDTDAGGGDPDAGTSPDLGGASDVAQRSGGGGCSVAGPHSNPTPELAIVLGVAALALLRTRRKRD